MASNLNSLGYFFLTVILIAPVLSIISLLGCSNLLDLVRDHSSVRVPIKPRSRKKEW